MFHIYEGINILLINILFFAAMFAEKVFILNVGAVCLFKFSLVNDVFDAIWKGLY